MPFPGIFRRLFENKGAGPKLRGDILPLNYGTCSTAAGTAAKTVALPGFALTTGAEVTVSFAATNTASNPTLNVNGTGAKPIQYRNEAIPAGYLAANRTYRFVYDGSSYELVGDMIAELQAQIDALVNKLASPWDCIPVGIPVPVEGVKFGGSDGRRAIMPGESKARENWIICDGGSDGKGGTVPDIRGRMILGASDEHEAGSTGGSETHTHSISGTVGATTLSVAQMPAHKHLPGNNDKFLCGGGNGEADINAAPQYGSYTFSLDTTMSGGATSHTHTLSGLSDTADSLPPYYTLAFVIRCE